MPNDSNWVVLCDPFVKEGVDRLYRFRHVDNTKHFTLFCADISQAAEVAFINDSNFRFIKKHPGPYTFILQAQKITTRHLKASKVDHQVGIRFTSKNLLKKLLEIHGSPAMGTHVDSSMLVDHPEDLPIWAAVIEDNFGHQIDTILDPGEIEFTGSSTIIDLSTDEGPIVIREGAGPID